MWGGLVVVTVAQLGVGFLYPVIDQWAHGAGLAAGIAFGALLSPTVKWANANKNLARVIAALFVVASITAAVFVAKTSVADSLAASPSKRFVASEVSFTAPSFWVIADNELVDPDGIVLVTAKRDSAQAMFTQMAKWVADAHAMGKARGFDNVLTAKDRVITLPDGWEGAELMGSFEDAMGVRQHYRMIVAGKMFGDALIQLVVMTPDSIARDAAGFFRQLIASAGPA
jgi:hypothetical protein